MPKHIFIFAMILTTLVNSCIKENEMNNPVPDNELKTKANELANKLLIIDSHIDVPYRLQVDYEDISKRTRRGHFDFERAKAGGLDALFMAIYVPAEFEQKGGGKKFAEDLINGVNRIASDNPDKFEFAASTKQVNQNLNNGKISVALGLENGTAIEGDLNNIQHFFNLGIRYITLTHSKSNHICDSSYDLARKWNGLSPFGEKVIKEMNRIGMMVDVSHVSDSAFYDIIKISEAPVIASHSSCRHFTPGWERNLSDEMIKTIAEKKGIIMMNFGSVFIDDNFRMKRDTVYNMLVAYLKENNTVLGDSSALHFVDEFFRINNLKNVSVGQVADHIDHVKMLVGSDYIGFGSDFDGVSFVPRGLDDVSMYPNLIFELLKRDYTDDEIEKICSKNFLRVWEEIENKSND